MKGPRERGRDIARPRSGKCLACAPVPKGRVSASDVWERARRSSVNYRVEIEISR